MTNELREKIPALCEQDGKGDDAVAYAKYFTPDSNWTWYVMEFDGDDLCFGLVDGFEVEMGYFTISELESVSGPLGLPIERDLYWTPTTMGKVREIVANGR